MVDILSEKGIKKYLKNPEMFDISVMDTVTSTNALLKEYTFASEGKIIIADSQSMGRGRFARKFYSPESCGIYMSILLKPTLPPENAVLITAAAAAAVSVACERLTNKNTQIKWVNDVLIEGKKVCGILTEGGIDIKTGNFDWAVVGIGINAYEPENGFDDEIKDRAGAVFADRAPERRNRLAAEIINRFWDFYKNLGNKTFFETYKSRMSAIGHQIEVIRGENKKTACCLDLDSECRLLVEYQNGEREYLSSGEISIRRI